MNQRNYEVVDIDPEISALVVWSPTFGEKKILIDAKDKHWITQYSWNLNSQGTKKYLYARNAKLGLLHRNILEAKKGEIVDHINRNTLDNRRANLRISSRTLNQANSKRPSRLSKYKGVHVETRYRKISYRAQIQNAGRHFHGVARSTEMEAAKDYNFLAIQLFGEHALLNQFDEEKEES